MVRFNRKSSVHRLFFSKFMVVVILILCAYLAVSVYERYTVEREMVMRRESVVEDYNNLLERKDSLLEKVEYLNGESGIESEIRKNFDVAKEGEQVVIIVDDPEGAPVELIKDIDSSAKDTEPWYKFW